MNIESLKLRGHRCFTGEWAGFDEYKPVNVIIGRNNVGKSQLLDLIRVDCNGWPKLKDPTYDLLLTGKLQEQDLQGFFQRNTSGGHLAGNHWTNHGALFAGVLLEWERNRHTSITKIRIIDKTIDSDVAAVMLSDDARVKALTRALEALPTPRLGHTFRHLLADRDIQPEAATADMNLQPNGSEATNIIRRHITSAHMNRELVQETLLSALNEIFGSDGQFTEIQARQHDSGSGIDAPWEIYLGQSHKGLIALSGSGSGLKTVILVLLNLLVMPNIEGKAPEKYIYAFEELENNLHPSLLRRLLAYIEKFAVTNNSSIFLTTHSNVALDIFGSSKHAQIIHVKHDGLTASTHTVHAHFDRLGVISELGARPADLLQANGIIWVEGPSDAIYLNRWIEIVSGGRHREGRSYVCAFYGGSLLARAQFVGPESAEDELVNLLQINPNVVVICDGDRTSLKSHLKPRVRRIREELRSVPGAILWITEPKEIEGYLSGKLLSKAFDLKQQVRDPERYELMFANSERDGTSYMESVLGRKSIDKIELAAKCAVEDATDLSSRFDWMKQMKSITDAIDRWNL